MCKIKFVLLNSVELLKVIRETENDDLTSVMQRIVITFDVEVTPLAVEMMTHLVSHMLSFSTQLKMCCVVLQQSLHLHKKYSNYTILC